MQIKGRVLKVGEIEKVGANETEKGFVLLEETEEKYPNSLKIDFWGDKLEKISGVEENDILTVEFNTSTNEYNDKVYNNIN